MNDYCLKADEEGQYPTCLEIPGAMGRHCEVCAAQKIESLERWKRTAEAAMSIKDRHDQFDCTANRVDNEHEIKRLGNRLNGANTLAGMRQMKIDQLEAELKQYIDALVVIREQLTFNVPNRPSEIARKALDLPFGNHKPGDSN